MFGYARSADRCWFAGCRNTSLHLLVPSTAGRVTLASILQCCCGVAGLAASDPFSPYPSELLPRYQFLRKAAMAKGHTGYHFSHCCAVILARLFRDARLQASD